MHTVILNDSKLVAKILKLLIGGEQQCVYDKSKAQGWGLLVDPFVLIHIYIRNKGALCNWIITVSVLTESISSLLMTHTPMITIMPVF